MSAGDYVRIRFWGTRGSIPTPGPDTVRFGGNTSCVELRTDSGELALLDCGTGARALGRDLTAETTASGQPTHGCIFIGHTHWDHIQGLPFFAPLFQPGNRWEVFGPRGLGQSLAHTLAGQMQYLYFPIALDQLGATVNYNDLVEGEMQVGELCVLTHYLNHPALALGYRIEADGVSVVYASDHEPHDRALAAGGDLLTSPQDARHVEFMRDADVVIHDTQYLAEEYPQRVGWGHSTVEYVVDAARLAGVGRLLLFHHDPGRDDAAVESMVQLARDRAAATGYEGIILAAAEGMILDVQRRAGVSGLSSGDSRSATFNPAVADLPSSLAVAVADAGVQSMLSAAAEAEQLEVFPVMDVVELRRALDGGESVVVFDHDEYGDSIDELRPDGGPADSRPAVLAITRGRPPERAWRITDWLVWPATIGHVRTKLRAAVLRRACRWQSAPLPPDEEKRVRALHALGILDTDPEERFDRYTREACDAFGVPVALVSLVDSDRQWFKSRQGMRTEQTPRDESLCAHAILGTSAFQVPDLLEDDRFAEGPAPAGEDHIRFYAGVPLVLSDGSRVGTFCVIDHRPRFLDDTQLEKLRMLAGLVQEELEAGGVR